ncbi:ABC transporter ATP-binding protein [Clostridium hydrogeniformans]|uniref:ABC transporter ATP-binding protein n=1 Tax=Clostridium hydrogeniformans TaxID=349933 RepID=UPI000481EB47|nr:ABC transporter ATP-binding protein [Clostridium hydrogeniformans]
MRNVIRLIDIKKSYSDGSLKTEVLKGITLDIREGEMVAIMGSSGSGKSTLLNIMGCIDKATEGEYLLLDKDTGNLSHYELAQMRNKTIGFVFQSFNLLDDYSLIDNVALPLTYSTTFKGSMKNKSIEVLKSLGLEKHLKKTPKELSGGEKQRVAIARALVNNPNIILADEPTGSLDKKTSEGIMNILKDINSKGKTVIIITHDSNIASHCNRILNLDDGIIELPH